MGFRGGSYNGSDTLEALPLLHDRSPSAGGYEILRPCTDARRTHDIWLLLRSLAEHLEDANLLIIHNPTKLYEHLLVKSP
jgi:hypothetical protein